MLARTTGRLMPEETENGARPVRAHNFVVAGVDDDKVRLQLRQSFCNQ